MPRIEGLTTAESAAVYDAFSTLAPSFPEETAPSGQNLPALSRNSFTAGQIHCTVEVYGNGFREIFVTSGLGDQSLQVDGEPKVLKRVQSGYTVMDRWTDGSFSLVIKLRPAETDRDGVD